MARKTTLTIPYQATGVMLEDLGHSVWERAAVAPLVNYWSGRPAPAHRCAEARLVWTPDALMVRYVCAQGEPLRVRQEVDLTRKTHGLWDFDVCEIFLAPERREHYFEFEVAPTGEWLDVAITWRNGQREPDWDYQAGLKTAARIEETQVTMALELPWGAFGRQPKQGERWAANLFRCVGPLDETRGYLAWQPTYSPKPDFHVPQAFGWLEFAG